MAVQDQGEFDVLGLAIRHWRRIAVCGVLGFAVAAAYAFASEEWYEARLSVVGTQPSRESAAMALAARLPGLDMTATDGKRIAAVLDSQSVADAVIEKFKLMERYRTGWIEDTRSVLTKHCTTSNDKLSGVVSLVCEDTDPETARAMAEYFGEVGNRVFARISRTSASEESAFLSEQVEAARKNVDEAARALLEFQEQHKVIDLTEQTKAVISAMASIKGELLSKQLELAYIRRFAGAGESKVIQLDEQLRVLESKLAQLEAAQRAAPSASAGPGSGAGSGSSGDFFPGAMTVPGLRFELERLLRDQKIKETVFAVMTQRYEISRVDAARDTANFQILDHPTKPTLKSRPMRRKIAMAGGLVGGLLGIAWVVIPMWWRRRFYGVRVP